MIAVKLLYTFVRSIMANLDGINHFDWWNDNIAGDGIQKPYPTPAVFFELGGITWEPSTLGSVKNSSSKLPEQVGNCEFTLHIIHKKIDSSAIDASEISHLDVVQAVYEAVHFSGRGEPFIQGAIQRLRDDMVLTHNVLRDWPMTFYANLYECPLADEVVDLTPWTAAIDFDLHPPYTDGGEGITFNID